MTKEGKIICITILILELLFAAIFFKDYNTEWIAYNVCLSSWLMSSFNLIKMYYYMPIRSFFHEEKDLFIDKVDKPLMWILGHIVNLLIFMWSSLIFASIAMKNYDGLRLLRFYAIESGLQKM